jgi:hypothetical protein
MTARFLLWEIGNDIADFKTRNRWEKIRGEEDRRCDVGQRAIDGRVGCSFEEEGGLFLFVVSENILIVE